MSGRRRQPAVLQSAPRRNQGPPRVPEKDRLVQNPPLQKTPRIMESDIQKQLMYIMERLGEPLCMGVRGGKENYYFKLPLDAMKYDSQLIHAAGAKEREIMVIAERKKMQVDMAQVRPPKDPPDLSGIREICPRKGFFSFFIPSHQQAFRDLTTVFMQQSSVEDFISTACYCRDNAMLNPHLFLFAFSRACLHRPDTKGFKFPALFEVLPGAFINNVVIKQAQELSLMPEKDRKVISANGPAMTSQSMASPISVGKSFTGRDFNPENKLAYFREDMGINSHHHHWHMIYNSNRQDRRGELFYYMHHSLLARYDAERLSNGLSRVKLLDVASRPILEEGYFPKLTTQNSGMNYGGRQENTLITDVVIQPDPDAMRTNYLRVDIEHIRKWKDRIFEGIESGYLLESKPDGTTNRIPLVPTQGALNDAGINVLANVVEPVGSINERFYGSMHNLGHLLISLAHDPEGHHKENGGAIGDLPTAMRDPAFYRWHKFVDDVFDTYKNTLQPYTRNQLVWDAVLVNRIRVETINNDKFQPNVLGTYWMQSDVDLSRGLDIRRSVQNGGSVWARVTHLNNEPFLYKISIRNTTNAPVIGTVRIYMAPRDNEHGQRLFYVEQRKLFFEMDKFTHQIPPGDHVIERQSMDSSVTIPWEQSFQDLERSMEQGGGEAAVCGCGWPQHMLLPRGTAAGLSFDLFVMVTNAQEDLTPEPGRTSPFNCKESISFCGILNEKYPDSKPMGFPFDRNPLPNFGRLMNMPPTFLQNYMIPQSNMNAVEVKIIHQPRKVVLRGNGAPADMEVAPPVELATGRNSGRSRTKSRSHSPSPRRNGRDSPDYLDEYSD